MSSPHETKPGVPLANALCLQETQESADLSIWVAWKNQWKDELEELDISFENKDIKSIEPLMMSFFSMRRRFQATKNLDHIESAKFWAEVDENFSQLIEVIDRFAGFIVNKTPIKSQR